MIGFLPRRGNLVSLHREKEDGYFAANANDKMQEVARMCEKALHDEVSVLKVLGKIGAYNCEA